VAAVAMSAFSSLGCYFSWTVENGQRVAANGDKYSCAPQTVLDSIRSGG
jgi:hypothetical protein